jgi:hypothetical protein
MFLVEWRIGKAAEKAPNPKLQAPEKLQISSTKKSISTCEAGQLQQGRWNALPMTILGFGVWDFSGAWNLGFGAFSGGPIGNVEEPQTTLIHVA